MSIDPSQSVGSLVAERITRARVLDDLGLDYCCHGDTPLDAACEALGLNVNDVIAAIARSDAETPPVDEPDYLTMPLSVLADHIETTHHAFMKHEIPRLQRLLAMVVSAHGDRHPELHELGQVFAALCDELTSHFMKEERVLFPLIRQLEAAQTLPQFHCGSVNNPIHVMEHEHDTAGEALAQMRALTGGYHTPADGCQSYQVLMEGLAAVETDLHRHIHKENNILFPRAAELEHRLAALAV